MNKIINSIILLFLVTCLLPIACEYDKDKSSSKTSDEISDIKIDVVKKPSDTITSDDSISVENCGPGKTTLSKAISSKVKKDTVVADKASVGISGEFEIPMTLRASLKAEIERSYQNMYEQALEEMNKIDKEIPAWTIINVRLQYEKQTFESEASFKKGKKLYKVPYHYTLSAPVTKSVQIDSVRCKGEPKFIDIKSKPRPLEVGDTTRLSAVLFDSMGNAMDHKQFFWESSDTSVAIVYQDGKVEARGQGKAEIYAKALEVKGKTSIVVEHKVRNVKIESGNITLKIGESRKLKAKVLGSDDISIEKPVVWSSSDENIVAVSKSGLTEGRWIGRATITATSEGVSGNSEVNVRPPRIPFPEKNIRIIVPFRVGSTADFMTRILAQNLNDTLRHSVLPWNMPRVGWKNAAASYPDGHTLTIYNNKLPLKGNPGLDDFEPIAMFAKGYGLLAPKGTPRDVIAVLEDATKTAVTSESFQKAMYRLEKGQYFVGSLNFIKEIKK